MSISEYVVKKREEMGLTQEDLSVKSNVLIVMIELIESRKRERPPLVVLERLASALEVDLGKLMVDSGLIDPGDSSTGSVSSGWVSVFGSGTFPDRSYNPALDKMYQAMKNGVLTEEDREMIDNLAIAMEERRKSKSEEKT